MKFFIILLIHLQDDCKSADLQFVGEMRDPIEMSQTGRRYETLKERQLRETIFITKQNLVNLNNKGFDNGLSSYQLALNSFADKSFKEYGVLQGSKITRKGENIVGKDRVYVKNDKNSTYKALPDSFDWRKLGGVTPAKFQGFECGSCWSFATTGAIEGHIFRKTGKLIPLSAQDLVDCSSSYGCMGCNGGYQEYAFEYVKKHGISLESRYPYVEMKNPECQHNESACSIRINGYATIEPGDEATMKLVIATLGPIACSINAGLYTFELYKGGIYADNECNNDEVNHSVAVVGYGVENGHEYWIIKNSYSPNWGENGFMKLPRNMNSFCGIADECSYPLIDQISN